VEWATWVINPLVFTIHHEKIKSSRLVPGGFFLSARKAICLSRPWQQSCGSVSVCHTCRPARQEQLVYKHGPAPRHPMVIFFPAHASQYRTGFLFSPALRGPCCLDPACLPLVTEKLSPITHVTLMMIPDDDPAMGLKLPGAPPLFKAVGQAALGSCYLTRTGLLGAYKLLFYLLK
jgi:hypothetical protein